MWNFQISKKSMRIMFLLMLTNILSWIEIGRLLDDDANELWNGIKYLKIIKNFESKLWYGDTRLWLAISSLTFCFYIIMLVHETYNDFYVPSKPHGHVWYKDQFNTFLKNYIWSLQNIPIIFPTFLFNKLPI